MKMAVLAGVFVTSLATAEAQTGVRFQSLFPMPKPVIAVINLTGLPGAPEFVSMEHSVDQALEQLKILEEEGVDAVLFENVDGDFSATPELTAAMTRIVSEAVNAAPSMIVGLEVLWHDPKASFAIAVASGAKFIRTDFFADVMKADGRIVDVDTVDLLKYRDRIGAEKILILADIQVKYATMIDPTKTITQSALDARDKGSDGVVVSGPKSGVPPSVDRVAEASRADSALPVILGSGTNPENVKELLGVADAAIVGTSISTKTGGVIVREKLQRYMKAVRELRGQSNPTAH